MTIQFNAEQFARIRASLDALSANMRAFNHSLARETRRIEWGLSISFANDPKQKRRLIRDRAREYRLPTLIHNGRKPRR